MKTWFWWGVCVGLCVGVLGTMTAVSIAIGSVSW